LFSTGLSAQLRPGDPARDFALPAVNGDTITLSSLRGKVVLLDFWASWCLPCRVANKSIGKVYAKYKDKGFEILGVSMDAFPADWKEAIEKDKISWLQVNEPGGWTSPTAMLYNVYALPTSYLIDQQGRLIAMDPTRKQLEKILKELLEK